MDLELIRMKKTAGVIASLLAVVMAGSLSFAQGPSGSPPTTTALQPAVNGTPTPAPAQPAPSAREVRVVDGVRFHNVYLRVDGCLAGRTSLLGPSGERNPARVRIALVQGGQVVQSIRCGEGGLFQAPRVAPGVYSVIAAGREGVGICAVRVLPYQAAEATSQPTALKAGAATVRTVALQGGPSQQPLADQSLLDITLIPASDVEALSAILAEELPGIAPPVGVPAGISGGGGGGGGGAGLGLLGLGGLGGLAGLAGEASPKAP
jgi:hypothetical protein